MMSDRLLRLILRRHRDQIRAILMESEDGRFIQAQIQQNRQHKKSKKENNSNVTQQEAA